MADLHCLACLAQSAHPLQLELSFEKMTFDYPQQDLQKVLLRSYEEEISYSRVFDSSKMREKPRALFYLTILVIDVRVYYADLKQFL
jgi:hypothetical protein